MSENKIVINQQEFPLHYKLLQIIAEMLPSEEHYAPLARAILSLQIPSITTNLISNGILGREDLDAIWESGNVDLRRALLEETPFRANLTDAQADEIMAANDTEMLGSLADNTEDFFMEEDGEEDDYMENDDKPRLSRKKARELLEFLLNHADASLRKRVAENPYLPAQFRLPLQATLEKGYLLNQEHLRNLAMNEVDSLDGATQENLLTAARWIESVENRKAQEKLAKLLLKNNDPAVRLELAQNPQAPKSVLKELARDSEQDVAANAKYNLEN